MKLVAATKIFAGALVGDRQALAYTMAVKIDDDLAMVLPLPVPKGSAEDAVRFVSLEAYPTLFADLARAFPSVFEAPSRGGFGAPEPARATLVVHEVGAFEASFVPTRDDFHRLDRRFRLPDGVLGALVGSADWGFAVFKLRAKKGLLWGAKRQSIHPMAFTFPTRDPARLFFPTVHVHDGTVPERARFDHELFAQPRTMPTGLPAPWDASTEALGSTVDTERSAGLVDPARRGLRRFIKGDQPNQDVWLAS